MRKFFLLFFLACTLVILYATFVEPQLLVVNNHTLQFEKVQGEPIVVAQFTDTHLGDFFDIERLERVVEKINEQDADLVIFSGDLFDKAYSYEGDINEVSEVLARIEANYGKFAIQGNRDNGGGAEHIYQDVMEQGGFTVLVNEQHRLEINGTSINLIGTDDNMLGNYDPVLATQGIREEDFNLLLIHEPDLISDFTGKPIDLALAGHSHGGQVYIPFVGPLFRNAYAEKYNRGFYEADILLYVNTGLGNTRLPFRFMTIPNVTVFQLEG